MSDPIDVVIVEPLTPENVTRKKVMELSSEDLRRFMKDPVMRPAIDKALNEVIESIEVPVEPTQEELDAKAAEEAAKAEADKIAAEAEAARLKAEAEAKAVKDAEDARIAAEAAKPKKFVFEFQAKDDEGNPIGRPTHLEAPTQEELNDKIKTSYENAVRALTRYKKQKEQLTFKKEEVKKGPSVEEQVEAAKDLEDKDPVKKVAAIRKITNADEVDKERIALAAEKESTRQAKESYDFLKAHLTDFNRCEANVKVLAEYLQANNLEWTVNNLEVAFVEEQSRLVPVVEKPAPPVPVIPAPVDNTPPVQAAPIVEPIAAPAQPPVVDNPPAVVTPRRVTPDIQPGSLTGNRPIAKPAGLTKAEIKSWTGEQMRKEMRNPARRAEIDKVLSSR
jgi:hypothetical protein